MSGISISTELPVSDRGVDVPVPPELRNMAHKRASAIPEASRIYE
jgi:hypothetical protein